MAIITSILSSHRSQTKQLPYRQTSHTVSCFQMATTACNFNLNLNLGFHGMHQKPMTWPTRAPSVSRGGNGVAPLVVTRAIDTNEFLGDFGARDPFPAELESSFGEKVLGYGNTEHRILIPNISALSLSQQDCAPISPSQPPISEHDAQMLVRKVTETSHHS